MSEPKSGEARPGTSLREIRARWPRHKSVTFERGGVPEPSRHRRGIFPIGLIRESSQMDGGLDGGRVLVPEAGVLDVRKGPSLQS